MREISVIKQNILKYLDFIGISKYEFYKITGLSNGILSQKNGMSEENTLKFLSYYPDINPEWLLTGSGDMLKGPVKVLAPPDVGNSHKKDCERLEKINELLEYKCSSLERELADTKKALTLCESARGVVKHEL
jgi:hypothetical protein